jgi:hypothetical protein
MNRILKIFVFPAVAAGNFCVLGLFYVAYCLRPDSFAHVLETIRGGLCATSLILLVQVPLAAYIWYHAGSD